MIHSQFPMLSSNNAFKLFDENSSDFKVMGLTFLNELIEIVPLSVIKIGVYK